MIMDDMMRNHFRNCLILSAYSARVILPSEFASKDFIWKSMDSSVTYIPALL